MCKNERIHDSKFEDWGRGFESVKKEYIRQTEEEAEIQHGRLLRRMQMRAHTTYQSTSNSINLIQPYKCSTWIRAEEGCTDIARRGSNLREL